MHVQNVHTMDELKMTGNCLKGSRGLVSFDKAFDDTEWGRLTKEVFTQARSIFTINQVQAKTSLFSDFWRTINVKEGETIYRPYSYLFDPGLKNLVP